MFCRCLPNEVDIWPLVCPFHTRSTVTIHMGRIMAFLLPSLLFTWLICFDVGTARNIRKPTDYVEYLPSTGLNVFLSAPHGGSLIPDTIPDRDAGCWDGNTCIWSHTCGTKDQLRCAATTDKDLNTRELTLELREALCSRFNGRCPAAVVNLLHRRKLDPNREVNEAAFGVPLAVEVYDEYHGYVTDERTALGNKRGLYIDIHGHGHTLQKAELGYLLTASELNSGRPIDPAWTSIRALGEYVGGDFDQLLRSGPSSFGALLEFEGFAAVPSPTAPGPGINAYFSGGYSTRVHGSYENGLVDGIQIESPRTFRELPLRREYVNALVNVIENYLLLNYPASSELLQ